MKKLHLITKIALGVFLFFLVANIYASLQPSTAKENFIVIVGLLLDIGLWIGAILVERKNQSFPQAKWIAILGLPLTLFILIFVSDQVRRYRPIYQRNKIVNFLLDEKNDLYCAYFQAAYDPAYRGIIDPFGYDFPFAYQDESIHYDSFYEEMAKKLDIDTIKRVQYFLPNYRLKEDLGPDQEKRLLEKIKTDLRTENTMRQKCAIQAISYAVGPASLKEIKKSELRNLLKEVKQLQKQRPSLWRFDKIYTLAIIILEDKIKEK